MRFLTDENFNGRIIRGLLARDPFLNILRWQDIGQVGAADPIVLEWAAQQDRILLTHDFDTMVGYANTRLEQGLPVPGVFVVDPNAALRDVIDDVLLIDELAFEDEYRNLVTFVPL